MHRAILLGEYAGSGPANSSARARINYHCRDELRLSNSSIEQHMTETKTLDIEVIQQKIQQESGFVDRLLAEVGRVIVGQKTMVERLLIGLLADGHVLLEGVPGLAKTLTVRTLADAIDTKFRRLQFTPDLLPAERQWKWGR